MRRSSQREDQPDMGQNERGRITLANIFLLAALLILPLVAMQRFANGLLWGSIYTVVMSGITYLAYGWDKQQARDNEWRMPEAKLHIMELLGGWPGAFLGQRRLRHKCSKVSYQVVFWLIVLMYQLAAFDSLQEWKWMRAVLGKMELFNK
jgi:uncharacterized membrane protein YsdA (DUF1294 family)